MVYSVVKVGSSDKNEKPAAPVKEDKKGGKK